MRTNSQRRNTVWFIGFLLLGGIFHYFDPTENLALNSFLFCGRYAVFSGLVLFWIQSVRSRLLPTRVRTYMIPITRAEMPQLTGKTIISEKNE